MKHFFYIFFFFCLSCINAFGQQGNHFVKNYLPLDYSGGANNFGTTQNENGIIFIANDNGVLIFDGTNWELCKRQDEISVQSINKTFSGEIVAGTLDGDIALISNSKTGKFQYTSLLGKLPKEKRPQEIIRQIVTIGQRSYFISADKLVEYYNGQLKAYEPKTSFHSRALLMGKHLFVADVGNHISVLEKGKLLPVEETEELSKEKYFFCYRLTATIFVVGFRNTGTYLVNYDSINPTKTRFIKKVSPCDKELIALEINNGCQLRNGNYIVTTNKKGAFELDKNLNIVDRFNSKNGVYEENIKSAFEDKNGNLWLASYYGVSFVEKSSRLFNYTRSNGIAGLIQSAAYFENKLFIATDKGVQYYDSIREEFVNLLDFNKQSWYLFSIKKKLFIGTAKGLFMYSNNQLQQVSENNTFCMLVDPQQPNVAYAGTETGFEIYRLNGRKIDLVRTCPLNSAVKSLAHDENKNIYFGTVDRGVFFLNSKKSNTLDSIQEKEGLPDQNFETFVFTYKERLLLGTYKGIYTVKNSNKSTFRCVKDPRFWPLTKESQVYRATQLGNDLICHQNYLDHEKNVDKEKITYIETVNTGYRVNTNILNHLDNISPSLISYDSIRNIAFICANEGLFLLQSKKIAQNKSFNLILKTFASKADVLIENAASGSSFNHPKVKIPYESNDILVTLGFTSYESQSFEFSYLLDGRDNKYTKWRKDNKLSFNNLAEGNYNLSIKAKTELDDKIYTLDIPFTILPPWYRSVYAYIIYFILFVAFVYVVVKLNSKRLVALNKKLEQTIEERTSTISHQKEEIEHKQKEIIDSINYAQRIQRALLASDRILKENLPDHFVLFQPKDVVSGDFYWASVLTNGHFALVTADSTGHGVPGAIMSMLNISCLKEAVESEKLTAPNNILNHTRKKVIETLANDGSAEGGKDGMDCSLVSFDLKNNQFSYAAANNPVWVVRTLRPSDELRSQGPATELAEVASTGSATVPTGSAIGVQLIELSPDKMPVGKHDRDTISFSQHIFELQKNDMVYTLTDGLPDQFGGPKGKKFMYKKLKEFLVSISQLPLNEQKIALQTTLNDWKGDLEQVDDVCIIGVRV